MSKSSLPPASDSLCSSPLRSCTACRLARMAASSSTRLLPMAPISCAVSTASCPSVVSPAVPRRVTASLSASLGCPSNRSTTAAMASSWYCWRGSNWKPVLPMSGRPQFDAPGLGVLGKIGFQLVVAVEGVFQHDELAGSGIDQRAQLLQRGLRLLIDIGQHAVVADFAHVQS